MKLKELFELEPASLETEAQRHIQNNAKLLSDRLDREFGDNPEDMLQFGKFLVSRCFLVAVSTERQASAFRVFSVMNSRGLELLTTDIIKADIIGNIRENNREKYTQKWEELEIQASRDVNASSSS